MSFEDAAIMPHTFEIDGTPVARGLRPMREPSQGEYRRIHRPRVALAGMFASLLALTPPTAGLAAGIELGSVGVQAVGRGGAFAARASDPTALNHNVAGLMGLAGVQWTASSNIGLWQHCFARAGRYDGAESGIVTNTTVFMTSRYPETRPTYPEVCNELSPGVVPQLLVTWKVRPWLAIGGGLLTPAGVGAQTFPDRVRTSAGLAPSPQRYQVVATNVIIVNPTLAVAVAPTSWLRVGAALQPSFARFAGETTANAIGSQSPATDIRTAANASGLFFAANLGVQLRAAPWIEVGLHSHLNPNPVTLSGTTTATVRPYAADPADRLVSQFQSVVTLPLPSLVRAGVRFIKLRPDAPEDWSERDPSRDEVFDVEIDAHFENSSVLQQVTTRSMGMVMVGPGQSAPATPEVVLRRGWRDTWGLRAGMEYNAIRSVLALRGGLSWDLGAQTGPRTIDGIYLDHNPDAGVDTAGYDTVGIHLGASARWRSLTFDFGYQHIFMGGQNVSQGRAMVVSGTVPISPMDCARGDGYPGMGACTNNRGVFTAWLDTISIGISGRH
jgi:long-subunit fatty acid transport protein